MAARRIEVIKNHLAPKLRPVINNVSADSSPRQKIVLSQFQKDFYEKNGYLLVKGLISEDIIEKCRVHFIDICNGVVDKGNMILMKEILAMDTPKKGEFLYNKVQDILNDDIFALYTEAPILLDYAEAFVGPNIMGMHSMLINKPPGTSIHPPHQDLHYFPFRPVEKIVAAWTAMEPVYKDNGCLYVVPGSQKGVLYHHGYPEGDIVNKAYHGIQNADEIVPDEKRVYLAMEKGDTVFFHPLLVHGSGPNTTANFRKAISCHYASSDCQYIETDGTSQENIAKEIVTLVKNKGLDIDYKTLWYLRGKLVRGERLDL